MKLLLQWSGADGKASRAAGHLQKNIKDLRNVVIPV